MRLSLRFGVPTLIGLVLLSSPVPGYFDAPKLQDLLQQAELFERQFEWEKAFNLYDAIARLDRSEAIHDRQLHCLRRAWQVRRQQDVGFQKDVLSQDYGQALRLYSLVFDTLLDYSLDRKQLTPRALFLKGMEELGWALADPGFRQAHLQGIKDHDIESFRHYLHKNWGSMALTAKAQVIKQVREVALAAHAILQLNMTVSILEILCGACYAVDDYSLYLSPNQLRELCDSLQGEMMGVGSVSYHMEADGLAYLHIAMFQETTVQEVDAALLALAKDNMKVLILDLRGNGGGIFEAAIEVAKRFLPSGTIASLQTHETKSNIVYLARNPAAHAMPLVVLVDGDTASAAEVLAGALKENKRGRLVGLPTFGKGCTQNLLKLPLGPGGFSTGGLRVTVARFFSPSGVPYSGRGVLPHLLVDRFLTSMSEMDPQMEEARIEAQRLLAMGR